MTTRSARLRAAAAEIDAVLRGLDTSANACRECGRRHFRNRSEARLYERLEALPERIRSEADKLEHLEAAMAPPLEGTNVQHD